MSLPMTDADAFDCATPRLRTKFGERAFSHAGPAAWNRLPDAVRQAQTQLHF